MWDAYPVGTWAKNLRTAARLADARAEQAEQLEQLEARLPDGAATGGCRGIGGTLLMRSIDPGWSPVRDAGWQRCLRLVQNCPEDGGDGQVTVVPDPVEDVALTFDQVSGWGQGRVWGGSGPR